MHSTRVSCLRAKAALIIMGLAPIAYGQIAKAADTVIFEIVADDMCCSGCAKKVAAQLYTAPGVTNVKANLATRTVVVTAKPSPHLTLEKLWNAAEKGKGKPSRLVANGTTYTLKRIADLSPEDQSPSGIYTLAISDLQPGESTDRIAKILYGIRGVSKVSVDAPHSALIVEPVRGAALSPWALAVAVQQAKAQPVSITGPHGRLSIEARSSNAQLSSRPNSQGENR